MALIYFKYAEVVYTSLNSTVVLWSNFGVISQQILGLQQIDHEFGLRLRKGVNILVSTPGRLVDHLGKTENLRLERVEWVVLDEADRMLELGYERDVRAVLDALQQKNQLMRQSLLLSATLTQVPVPIPVL
jgi:superfamily II DNA/RNA helicase